jgi:Phosphoribosylformylglycinamidine (FGAM) synthase, synthetase domain
MVGLIKDIKHYCSSGFKGEGETVYLLGPEAGNDSLGSSEYLQLAHGQIKGSQQIDIAVEQKVQACVIKAIERGLLNSAHDCSDGGLVVALAECCILGNTGFNGRLGHSERLDTALFGEGQSRIIVSVKSRAEHRLEILAARMGAPLVRLGRTGGTHLIIKGLIDLPVSELHQAWWNTL